MGNVQTQCRTVNVINASKIAIDILSLQQEVYEEGGGGGVMTAKMSKEKVGYLFVGLHTAHALSATFGVGGDVSTGFSTKA